MSTQFLAVRAAAALGNGGPSRQDGLVHLVIAGRVLQPRVFFGSRLAINPGGEGFVTRVTHGGRTESVSILLEFQGTDFPARVKTGYEVFFPVRPSVPPTFCCYKCHLMCQQCGHIAAVCKGKQRRPKRGGDHRVEECRGEVQDKCCNCVGQHRVTYCGCEMRKRAAETQQIKTVNSIR